jgi:hypothetical protein
LIEIAVQGAEKCEIGFALLKPLSAGSWRTKPNDLRPVSGAETLGGDRDRSPRASPRGGSEIMKNRPSLIVGDLSLRKSESVLWSPHPGAARFAFARDNGGEDFLAQGGRRNPLKSLDSAKGIQGNPSFFL